jgi:hypothetical protein
MRITIELATANASFETESDYQFEITRILNAITSKVANGLEYCKIRDLNGNTIGFYQVEGMPDFEEVENYEND